MRTRKAATPNFVCDTWTHATHLVAFLHTASTVGNRTASQALPLVDDIAAIAKLDTEENAIIIAQAEIDYLDDLSLEGDIPDNISDIVECDRKICLQGVKFYNKTDSITSV